MFHSNNLRLTPYLYVILVFLSAIVSVVKSGKNVNPTKREIVQHSSENGELTASDLHLVLSRLFDGLLKEYNTAAPPLKSTIHNKITSNYVQIYFGVSLHYILRLDSWNNLHTSINLHQAWLEKSLIWDPKKYSNIRNFSLPSHRLWTPDIFIEDSLGSTFEDTPIIVQYNGLLSWDRPILMKTICEPDYRFYPFDVQECLATFTLWNPEGELVLMNLDSDKTENWRQNVDWKVLNFSLELLNPTYTDTQIGGAFPIRSSARLRIRLQRNPTNIALRLIVPIVALSTLIPLSFLTPFKLNGRLILNFIILSLFMFLAQYWEQSSFPTIAETYYGRYLLISKALALISIIQTLFFKKDGNEFARSPVKITPMDRLLFGINSAILIGLNVLFISIILIY